MNYGKRHSKITKKCLICKEKFTIIYARRHKNYCSPICGYKATSEQKKHNNPGAFKKTGINEFLKKNPKKYNSIHKNWVRTNLGKPDTCEFCKKSGLSGHAIHWANISGKYKKEPSDWIRLCAKCHFVYDRSKAKK